MVELKILENKLNNMSPKEVREYAKLHYPKLYFFRTGSKATNIEKILCFEENLNVLDMIARMASQ